MSECGLNGLKEHLERLVPLLPLISWKAVQESPEIRVLLKQVVETLVDTELLQEFGYPTIDQACTMIRDILEKRQLPRTKVFSHCGQEHQYHALQAYVNCPICRSYRWKTRSYGEVDIVTVAGDVLYWLGIDWKSIPDWNPECDDVRPPTRPAAPETAEPPTP
jgi:hypothetical protein